MIIINGLPCETCKHYKGVVKPDGTEMTEHIKCTIAKQKDAKNMLNGIQCDRYKKDETRTN